MVFKNRREMVGPTDNDERAKAVGVALRETFSSAILEHARLPITPLYMLKCVK